MCYIKIRVIMSNDSALDVDEKCLDFRIGHSLILCVDGVWWFIWCLCVFVCTICVGCSAAAAVLSRDHSGDSRLICYMIINGVVASGRRQKGRLRT